MNGKNTVVLCGYIYIYMSIHTHTLGKVIQKNQLDATTIY